MQSFLEFDENTNIQEDIKKMSTADLQKHWDSHKDQERPSPAFAAQLKRVAMELKARKAVKTEEKKITIKTKMGGEIPATIKMTGKDYHIVKADNSGKQYRVDHQGNSIEEEIELDEVTIAGTPGWEKIKKNVTDKSGAVHTPMSRVRDLARQALRKQIEKQPKKVKEGAPEFKTSKQPVKMEEEVETDTSEKHEMAETQLHFIKYAAEEILEYIGMGGEIEEWYQNKLSKVQSEVESLHSYIEGESRRLGLKEQVQKADIPAYLRKLKGDTPLKLSDLKRKDTLSDKENLAKAKNEAYDSPLDTPAAKKAREELRKTLLDIKKKDPKHPAVQDVKEQAPVAPTPPGGYIVKYHDEHGEHVGNSKMFYNKNSANIHALKGNAINKVGGKYTVHAVNAKGHEIKEAVKMSALDKFRAAAAEREKKHDEIERKRKEAAEQGKENMSGAIDRLQAHLNKEEVQHKIGDSVTVNSKFFGKQKGKVVKVDDQSVHVKRNGKKYSEKYPHDSVMKEESDEFMKDVKKKVAAAKADKYTHYSKTSKDMPNTADTYAQMAKHQKKLAEEELEESRGNADKYWDSAERHKAEAQKQKVGSEAYHTHMSKHYDAKSQYHDDLGQHSAAEKAGDRSEEHYVKAQQASN